MANGYRLEGQWSNGKLYGYGVETKSNGFRFEGQWRNSKRNGRGVMTFSDGSRCEGEWSNEKQLNGYCISRDGTRSPPLE
jgi:hypothetical protein